MATKKSSSPPRNAPVLEPAVNCYGFRKIPGTPQFVYDAAAFADRTPMTMGAPSRIKLFKKYTDVLLPGHFEWHDWAYRFITPLCPDEPKQSILVGYSGCSNSAKSFHAASFACAWWRACPEESSVTFVSTTIKALRRRGWSEVQKCYSGMVGERFGNFIDSRMVWQAVRGDDKHAIIGKAVEEGSTQKVADDIKGVHTRRQMFIIDEATSIPEAIYTACNNMYSYPDEFIMIVLGNAFSRLDQHGLFCEPEHGWNSVNVDTGEWDAKPFLPCGGIQPRVITFDAQKSPNITEGRMVSRHLPKKEEVEAGYKASGNGQTPLWWSNMRGFWPPEGLVKTVFTESMLLKFDGYGRHHFQNGSYTIITALDQAYGGGDNPCLRRGKIGTLEGGGWGIEVLEPIMLSIRANDKDNPARYQLKQQLQALCEKVVLSDGRETSCQPHCVGVDDTGDGGLGDIIWREWSHAIQRIHFNGGPSEEQISLEDIRPAKEFCKNKRTEMFLYARAALQCGQLKGIDKETATELCSLEVMDDKRLVTIQSKEEYRSSHGGKSPDRADSLVMLLEVARRNGFQLTAIGQTAVIAEDWDKTVKETQEIYFEENTYQPEEIPDDAIETLI